MKPWMASASCFHLCHCQETLSCGQGRAARESWHLWIGSTVLADPGHRQPPALRIRTQPDATHSEEMVGTVCPSAPRPCRSTHSLSSLSGAWIWPSMTGLWQSMSCSPGPLSLSHPHMSGAEVQATTSTLWLTADQRVFSIFPVNSLSHLPKSSDRLSKAPEQWGRMTTLYRGIPMCQNLYLPSFLLLSLPTYLPSFPQ